MKYYSQDGQDKFLLETIFNNQKTGFYVDIGANDGITLSNTKALEDSGWNGICIEPLPNSFDKLIQNRKCKSYNVAINDTNSEIKFLKIDGYSEMLSGILDNYDNRHLARIDREIQNYGGKKEIIEIKGIKFSDLIAVKNIDYLSIDVEGSEMNILRSINFDNHHIKYISVENNYGSGGVEEFLKTFGYKFLINIGADNFFIKE